MEGDEEPQRFIAPNYLVISEGHYNIFPASSYSLVIHIEEELIDHGKEGTFNSLSCESRWFN